ncbi:polyphosphate polymerase domain-containing protein [Zafaria sp. Z1313]|uniref:polyphosphate polymerase domain-containing protein n=1 Tax=unclassified Zafaria TaxID=2828765 RepID=UPI002E75D093|nr:polyphosphate polymerase domain-containing protein [Zafaria sp. J156]MEE1621699.1 polyphosphate polymerase domain-containing protein [Zafaria sp. J156]
MNPREPRSLTHRGSVLEPIGLEELNEAAALQTRIDRKYVVDAGLANALFAGLPRDTRVLEIGGLRRFRYDSVYFDTPELTAYRLAAAGRRRRFKIRTRTYLDTGTAFLEVKTEGARAATVKERIPHAPADRSRLTPEGAAYVAETLAAALGPGSAPDTALLRPVVETAYSRTTLYLPGSGARATIDEDATWRLPGGPAWTLDGRVIVETKSGSRPGELDRMLWRHGVRPAKISKFATGLAALDPRLPSNKWTRTLRRGLPLRAGETPPLLRATS